MATNEEMCKMINAMEDDDKGWIARLVWGNPDRFPESILKEITWQALRQAEEDGRCCNGPRGTNEWCTQWIVGDYIITYYTDDEYFNTEMLPVNAEMLTEEMMDDLIIEEV